ncbi:MAG: MFS transporter [Streptosporangiaceae bacterium]|nr:MFS transporter [Streptosporangiaceae bacterium]
MTALRNRDFRHLWLAGLISDTGDWMLLVALPILVYQLTGSTLGTSMAFLIELIPALLITPLAGRLADRVDRRTLLVAISLAQAAALLPLLAGTHLPVLYCVIALQAALASLFDPAKNALLPTLVAEDQLVAANSLIGLNQNLGRLVGAALGGAALMGGGLSVIVIGDTASFLLSAALIWTVHPASATVPMRGASSPRTGGHPFARRSVQVGLAVTAITAIGQGLFIVLFVVFVARNLHGSAAENGLLRAVQAIGAIAGGLVLSRATRIRPGRLAGLACLVFGALAALTWNLPHATIAEPVYVALFICFGIPSVAMVSGLISSLQQATADGERGRVFAALGAAFASGQAVGMVTAGILGDGFGAVPLLNVQAICYLVGGVAALAGIADPGGSPRPERPAARMAVRSSGTAR